MNLVNAPIQLGQKSDEVANLQQVLLFLMHTGAFTLTDATLINGMYEEMQYAVFGNATLQILRAFAVAESYPEEVNMVDAGIAVRINGRLAAYSTAWGNIVIRGVVKHISGKMLSATQTVTVYNTTYTGRITAGTVETDAAGNFTFSYNPQVPFDGFDANGGFQFAVTVNDHEYTSGIIFPKDISDIASITIDDAAAIVTEFDDVYNALHSIALNIASIDISSPGKLDYLVEKTGEDRAAIVCMVRAMSYAGVLGDMNSELMYGMLRNSVVQEMEALLYQPASVLKKAITLAVVSGTIASTYTSGNIDTFVETLSYRIVNYLNMQNSSDAQKSATFSIVKHALGNDDSLALSFLSFYFNYEAPAADSNFWTALVASDGSFTGYVGNLKAAIDIARLSGSNPALVNILLDMAKTANESNPDPGYIARNVVLSTWSDLINTAKAEAEGLFFYPDFVTGDTDEERDADYAARLDNNFNAAYPTHNVIGRIASDGATPFTALKAGLAGFVGSNPAYDFRTVSIVDLQKEDSSYNFSAVADKDAFIHEVASMQRLMNLTSNYNLISALAQNGLTSAVAIVQQEPGQFAANYATAAGGSAQAAQAQSFANTVVVSTIGVAYNHYTNNVTLFKVLDASLYDPQNAYADWRTLFGSLDSCSCSQCSSVYSPAAYLADILRFLKMNNATIHDHIVNVRRPDIRDILLNCNNTNVPVPHIDVVNELLEDIVSTGQYKMYARETVANADYQRAMPEYINTAGLDLQASDNNGTISIVHVDAPYNKLKSALYSWSLPYNFYKRQIDTHLDMTGIKSYELAQRFGNMDLLKSLNENTHYAAAYIGVSNEEQGIITNEVTSLYDLAAYYGFAGTTIPNPALKSQTLSFIRTASSTTPAAQYWGNVLSGRVDVFLQQTGLSFTELLQLLDCYSLNPYMLGSATTRRFAILAIDSADDSTCDLSKLKIANVAGATYIVDTQTFLTADGNVFAKRLYRFVRLARALGWSYYELDRALRAIGSVAKDAFAGIDEDTFRQLAQMKYLAAQLRISIEDICTLRSGIEHLPYRDYTGSEPVDIANQFQRIFYNPLLTNIKAEDYPFTADGVVSASGFIISKASLYNHLAGIMNIPQGDLTPILDEQFTFDVNGQQPKIVVTPATPTTPASTPVAFDSSNCTLILSRILRQVILAKALKLKVADWQFYQRWIKEPKYFNATGGTVYTEAPDPFSDTFAAIRFVAQVKLIAHAGFTPADIEYLLRDNIENAIAEGKQTDEFTRKIESLRSGLAKIWYASYDAAHDAGSKALKEILGKITDEEKASKLVAIIERASDPDAVYTTDDQFLVSSTLSFFIPANGVIKLTDPLNFAAGSYMPYPADRREYVYECYRTFVITTVLKPFIASFVSKEFKVDENIADLLLSDCVSYALQSGYDILLSSDYISSTAVADRWNNAVFTEKYYVVALLDKASVFISKFGLGYTDLQYLWTGPNAVITDVPVLSSLPLRSAPGPVEPLDPVDLQSLALDVTYSMMTNMIRWMLVRVFVADNMVALYQAIAQASLANADIADMRDSIAAIFSMNKDDVSALLGDGVGSGTLGALFAADYGQPDVYLRMIDCLEMQYLLPASMTALSTAAANIYPVTSSDPDREQKNASAVIHLVKAQYDDKQWLEAVTPVNDMLRAERRNALVSYLISSPMSGTMPALTYQWVTDNDIYETLMLDVDMTPCMATTRVLLATNTVQVYIDRILMGLEPGYSLSKSAARQWDMWRKFYRVWEANRKIFMYPENWIEPELRDDKTPFFLELEKFLKQNEVTQENVEDAYLTYLERLDEVANLDIVGMYREPNAQVQSSYKTFAYSSDVTQRDVLHVFGRTKANPHIYFYRKRVADEWTAWEKMDVQIDGEHFVPVMWRGRLRFYWFIFTKDQQQNVGGQIRDNQERFPIPPMVRWKIEIAWTEYKNGKWTAKQMGKDPLYSGYIVEEDPTSIDQIQNFSDLAWKNDRWWYFDGSLDRQKKMFMHIYARVDGDGHLRFDIMNRTDGGRNTTLYSAVHALQDKDLKGFIDQKKLDQSYIASADRWPDNIGGFVVKFNGVSAVSDTIIGPNFYMPYDGSGGTWNGTQNNNAPGQNYELNNTDFHYLGQSSAGYKHYPDNDLSLLGNAPETSTTGKYVVFPRNLPQGYSGNDNIMIPHFFYKDYYNTFFVEKVVNYLSPGNIQQSPQLLLNGVGTVSSGGTGTVGSLGSGGTGAIGTGGSGNVSNPGGIGTGNPGNPTQLKVPVPQYRFHNFIHDKVEGFIEKIYSEGLDGLLNRTFITGPTLADNIDFNNVYQPFATAPNAHVDARFPTNNVDFAFDGAYSMYNWELFFHIPLLIANKLMQNQQFDDARKWYHYVFNPTNVNASLDPLGNPQTIVNDFWNFQPFYDIATSVPSIADTMSSTALQAAVDKWANDPFKPHLVARTRISAYMKNTVMKYLDNLIAWADNLYSMDTRETINEATLLYVQAAQMLGRRPLKIPARAKSATYSYAGLAHANAWNAFSDAMVQIESILLPSGATAAISAPGVIQANNSTSGLFTGSMFYFCLPSNDQMDQYWDIVADRLFKIRNCQNIDGVEQDLALFAPPIDPALLVKAAASGLSLSAALADINAPLPQYRFNVLSQKATELTQEVKGLGSQLLSALEKKDAEMLALLRSSQEIKVLEAITDVKQKQIDEAQAQIDGIVQQQAMTTQRRDYYQGLVNGGLNPGEQLQLDSMTLGIGLTIAQGTTAVLAGLGHLIPNVMIGAFSAGAQYGGDNFGKSTGKSADVLGIATALNNQIGSMAGIKGGYARRKDEWTFQMKLADTELKQLDKQLLAAQIRHDMAETELKNHELQKQNAYDMDAAMHDKYTNEDLYDWMIGQISLTYFQAYKLAVDTAKKAERCYRNELNLETSDFIQFGYWDSLKKGLLAGEQLAYDIKRMEVSYLDLNKRQLELTKHVSLAALNPDALMALRINKACTIDLPEWLFDMDYPGQHMRRIKSVSLTIPCVSGPYTTISCKLSLLKSKYRKNGTLLSDNYEEQPDDIRFVNQYGNIQSIVTSGAQNDSGLFEFNFRDERYLPFEGAGAISTWRIELPAAYAQFDYNSISDLILHVKYTALDNGATRAKAIQYVQDTVDVSAPEDASLFRMFSLRQEFPEAWQDLLYGVNKQMTIEDIRSRFPYLAQVGDINVSEIELFADRQDLLNAGYTFHLDTDSVQTSFGIPIAVTQGDKRYWKLSAAATPATEESWKIYVKKMVSGTATVVAPQLLKDIWMVVHYSVSPSTASASASGGVLGSGSGTSGSNASADVAVSTAPDFSLPISKMLAWWKADAGINLKNGLVDSWEDQTGHGNTLAAPTGARPALIPNWNNGKPALQFNGSQALRLGYLKLLQNGATDVTVFMVGRKTAVGTGSYLFELGDNYSNINGFAYILDYNGNMDIAALSMPGNNQSLYGFPGSGISTEKGVYVINYYTSYPNPETSIEFNGKLYDYPTPYNADHIGGTFNNAASFNVGSKDGSSNFANFELAELILMPSMATDQEKDAIKSYLDAKYNINVTPGLKAWWKADNGVTVDSGVVAKWADASGNGNDLLPLASYAQPKLSEDCYNQPTVLFDDAILVHQGSLFSDGDDFTIVYAGLASVGRGLQGYGNGGSFLLSPSQTNLAGIGFNWSSHYECAVTHTPATSPRIVVVTVSQSASTAVMSVYDKDGDLISTQVAPYSLLTNSPIGFAMGCNGTTSSFSNGPVYEVMVYNKVLNATEISKATTYLGNKYNIQSVVALPAQPDIWWKADEGVNVVNGVVNTWDDASGNGNGLTGVTGFGSPQFTTVNNRPAVLFKSGNALSSYPGVVPDNGSFTVFYVGSAGIGRGLSAGDWSFSFTPTGTPNIAQIVLTQNGTNGYTIAQPGVPATLPVIAAVTVEQSGSTTVSLYNKAGALITTPSVFANTVLRSSSYGFNLGAAGTGDSFTYEALVYNRVLSTNEIAQVMAFLNTKYFVEHQVLPSSLKAWWRADVGVNATGMHVNSWSDSSGNGYDLLPFGGTDSPTLISDINGLPAVQFNNSILQESTGILSNTDSFTIFYVGTSCIGRGVGPYANIAITPVSNGLANIVLTQNGDYQYTLTQPSYATSPVIVAVTLSQNTSDSVLTAYDKNGQVINSMTAASSVIRNAPTGFGMGYWWNYLRCDGISYEALVYNRVLGDTELKQVLSYLNTKYNDLAAPEEILAWWRADAGTVLQSGNVDTWNDQSGKGNNISAFSAATRPGLITNWQNGLPGLSFTGTEALRMSSLVIPPNTPDVTVFMVAEKTSTDLGYYFELSDDANYHPGSFAFDFNTNDVPGINSLGGWSISVMSPAIDLNQKAIYQINFYMTDPLPESTVEYNGVPRSLSWGGVDHVGQSFVTNSFNIGSNGGTSSFAHMNMGELIIIPSRITPELKAKIYNYLKSKYNL